MRLAGTKEAMAAAAGTPEADPAASDEATS
jgi:hypothetical protein